MVVSRHEWTARSLESVLAPKGHAILRVSNGLQAIALARDTSPDLILVHDDLPDFGGADLCRALRADPAIGYATPIMIVATEPMIRERRLECLRAGAWDVLRMPTDPEELLLRLDSFLKAKVESNRTREESLVDPITGLYSTRGLVRRIEEVVAGAIRYSRPLACIAISTGGEDGAAVENTERARQLASAFRSSSRVCDSVGRVGRTEFVIVAPDTDPAGAQRLAERLTERLSEMAGSDGVSDQVRIGYFAVPNLRQAAVDPAELIGAATLALRRTQARGDDRRIEAFDGLTRTLN